MDWAKWHEKYEVSPAMKARLVIVREHLSRCLDLQPPGPIQILSICAGDARDLIGLMEAHPRKKDVNALLVENNSELVEAGRKVISEAGIESQLTFSMSDATISSTYVEFVPVDIALLSGVFGNLRPEECARLIRSLCSLCKRGGYVVWTRHRQIHGGLSQIALIRQHFEDSRFEEVQIGDTADDKFTIATYRYQGAGEILRAGGKLFEFTGYDQM